VFADTHGTLLVAKLVILGGMLWAAHGNRQRVFNVVRSAGAAARPDVDTLRRAMVIELVIGLVIIGITAAMVVSPPTVGP
jgi:putative copper export protein